jgi:hypothetical protein
MVRGLCAVNSRVAAARVSLGRAPLYGRATRVR